MTTPTSVPTAQTQPPKDAKPAGTRLGFSNYLGLLGALLAMIALYHYISNNLFAAIIDGIVFLAQQSNSPHYAPFDITGGKNWVRQLVTA